MKADELIAELRAMGQQDAAVIFNYLAKHAMEARLAGGQRLCDVTDFAAWLRELSEAAKVPAPPYFPSRDQRPAARPAAQSRWDKTCPRCGHVHQGGAECGEAMGGGGICRCELDVPS
jgi:hypothetical protein